MLMAGRDCGGQQPEGRPSSGGIGTSVGRSYGRGRHRAGAHRSPQRRLGLCHLGDGEANAFALAGGLICRLVEANRLRLTIDRWEDGRKWCRPGSVAA
jgi:hypothetical protein